MIKRCIQTGWVSNRQFSWCRERRIEAPKYAVYGDARYGSPPGIYQLRRSPKRSDAATAFGGTTKRWARVRSGLARDRRAAGERAGDTMSSDREYRKLQGVRMDRAEIDDFLADRGVGLLALADGGRAYAVPISFGYDGDSRLYFFLLRFGEDSEKIDYADRTASATFAVYDVETPDRWRSVLARGPVETVPEERHDEMEAVMYDNAWSARLFPYSDPITEIRRAELRIEDATGQKGAGYE
jgi:hypothetical protein